VTTVRFTESETLDPRSISLRCDRPPTRSQPRRSEGVGQSPLSASSLLPGRSPRWSTSSGRGWRITALPRPPGTDRRSAATQSIGAAQWMATRRTSVDVLMDINGASAIVTGGASGIGAASARQLAAKGARVVVADLQRTVGQNSPNKSAASSSASTSPTPSRSRRP
jgi:hypothetical protein